VEVVEGSNPVRLITALVFSQTGAACVAPDSVGKGLTVIDAVLPEVGDVPHPVLEKAIEVIVIVVAPLFASIVVVNVPLWLLPVIVSVDVEGPPILAPERLYEAI
jgi:hypothetical protein